MDKIKIICGRRAEASTYDCKRECCEVDSHSVNHSGSKATRGVELCHSAKGGGRKWS